MDLNWVPLMEKSTGYLSELAALWYWKDGQNQGQQHQLDTLRSLIDQCKTCINQAKEEVEDNHLGHA